MKKMRKNHCLKIIMLIFLIMLLSLLRFNHYTNAKDSVSEINSSNYSSYFGGCEDATNSGISLSSGSYYLTSDLNLSTNSIYFYSNAEIDLKGHSIDAKRIIVNYRN